MVLSKIYGSTSSTDLERSVLGFRDNDQVRVVLNEIFLLVITTTIINFGVSQFLIDNGSSCNIMYDDIFERIGLKKQKLLPYEVSDLQSFNGIMIRP